MTVTGDAPGPVVVAVEDGATLVEVVDVVVDVLGVVVDVLGVVVVDEGVG